MNSKRFKEVLQRRLELTSKVLDFKGQEYSSADNKLHNFEKAARISGQTREQALKGMLLKHEVSISDIIEKTSQGEYPSQAVIDEKIGDIINYYILLEACFADKIDKLNKEA
jgi:hypothetical protein